MMDDECGAVGGMICSSVIIPFSSVWFGYWKCHKNKKKTGKHLA
jgi:hypothetical protein